MEQNTVTINQLIAQILDEMRRIGYSEATIWRYYQPAMGQFRKYYGQTGQAVYSPEQIQNFGFVPAYPCHAPVPAWNGSDTDLPMAWPRQP